MYIKCPKNPKHDRFSTTAHVMQEWVVDKSGGFVRVTDTCLQTDQGPEKGNIFTCLCREHGKTCGAEAIVEET